MKAQMEEQSQSTQTYLIYNHCLRTYFKPQNIIHCEISLRYILAAFKWFKNFLSGNF